jgi:tetratricopeptide (TPR) repeat protein
VSEVQIGSYLASLVAVGIPILILFRKVGLSCWWGALLLIPLAGIWMALMILAFARWPAQRSPKLPAGEGGERLANSRTFARSVLFACAVIGAALQAVAQSSGEERCAGTALGPDAAIRACTRDIESGMLDNEDLSIAHSNRGLNWSKKGDLDQALSDCSAAIELDPGRSAAYLCRGHVLTQKNELDQAMADFERAIAIDPGRAIAHDGRGLIWLYRGDFDRAVADFSQAILLNSENAEFYAHRGNARIGKGVYDEAVADLEHATSLEPSNAGFFFDRGNARRGLGDVERARSDYETAVQLDPGNAEYVEALATVRLLSVAGAAGTPQLIARAMLLLAAAAAFLFPMWRVIARSGRSRWQFLLFAIPIANLVFLWVFAFSRWPSLEPGTVRATAPSVDGHQGRGRSPAGRRGLFLGLAVGIGIAAVGYAGRQLFLLNEDATSGDEPDANLPLPDGIYLVLEETGDAAGVDAVMIPNNESNSPPLRVIRDPLVHARHFARAEAAQDALGSAIVSIQLNEPGSDQMRIATSENIGRKLAIVVNGVAITVATINSPIAGQIQITGGLTLPQAQAIARRLNR